MIRAYTSQDLGDLIELLRLNTPTYFHPSEEDDFVKYLEQVDLYFVYESEGVIWGCGGINRGFNDGEVARISWDIVHPEAHGRGIGTSLVNHRLQLLKQEEEVKKVVVRTSQLAYKYYEKMGFTLVKIKKDYWSAGLDLYYMEHPIDRGQLD